MNMVTVATFNRAADAEPLRNRMEKAGVHAEIVDESKFEWFWFVTKPLAGIRLKVHKKDFDSARLLIAEWDATDRVLRDAVRCPQCKGSRIEYPQFTRKFFLPNLVGLASTLGIFEKEFFCQDCECTWPKDGPPKPPQKHSSPYYFIEDVPPASAHGTAQPIQNAANSQSSG